MESDSYVLAWVIGCLSECKGMFTRKEVYESMKIRRVL
jgi:hypothetical protein